MKKENAPTLHLGIKTLQRDGGLNSSEKGGHKSLVSSILLEKPIPRINEIKPFSNSLDCAGPNSPKPSYQIEPLKWD